MALHVIDDRCDPDPRTIHGTTDLVAFFYRLKFLSPQKNSTTPYPLDHDKALKRSQKTKRPLSDLVSESPGTDWPKLDTRARYNWNFGCSGCGALLWKLCTCGLPAIVKKARARKRSR